MVLRERLLSNFFKYKRKLSEATTFTFKYQRTFTLTANCHLKPPKILFFGTDNFSLPSLKLLYENNIDGKIGTVTSFKSPANCVRLFAEKCGIPIFRWPISPEICKDYELGVVVSFGHMIPRNIINALPLGMINVHASLLPRWRGAAPIIYALMHGDMETGVSIMKIEPKHFDIGDILAQRTVPIGENTLMPELHETLAHQGAELLLTVINDYHAKAKYAKKQDESLVTYAPKVTAALTEIVWSSLRAKELYNRFRALYGFKQLITRLDGKSVQLFEIKLPSTDAEKDALQNYKTPGSFVYLKQKKCLLVRCAMDTFIEIHQLRVEGRKVMNALDFNNGFLKKLKSKETCFVANKNAICF